MKLFFSYILPAILILLLFAFIVECSDRTSAYDAGYMYWYGPSLLEAAPWSAVATGTVNSVSDAVKDKKGRFIGGEIEIKKVIFSLPTKDDKSFSVDILKCNGGFGGLSKGDKVLVFLIEYEGAYSIPDYQGSSCSLGVKLESFDDSIIGAARRAAMNGVIDKKDYSTWKIYDPKGLERRIKMQEFQEMQKKKSVP